MPITAICQACHHRFQAPDAFAGRRVKCRHCGQVFQVPMAEVPPGGTGTPLAGRSVVGDLGALESLGGVESMGTAHGGAQPGRGGTVNGGSSVNRAALVRPPAAVAPPPSTFGGHQLDPDEQTADDDDGEEDEADASGAKPGRARRPNFPVLSYPGAQVVDQGLPMALPVLGLGWLALLVSGDPEGEGKPWILVARFAIPVLLYRVAIFPFLYAGLAKAAKELNYHLPPNPKLRAFAAYMPAFLFATGLWIMGQGSLPGMIVGLTIGLVLSSMVLFLLFRLRENEAATTIAYAAYGFTVGAVLTALLIVGLNYVTGVAVVRQKGQASVPVSPYATGLPWLAKPPTALTTEGDMVTHADRPRLAPVPPPVVPTFAPAATPTVPVTPTVPAPAPDDSAEIVSSSPLLSDLHTLSLPAAAGATVVQPLSDAAVLALVRPAPKGAFTAVAWNATTDRQVGTEVALPMGLSGPAVIDNGGQYLVHLVTWPRRSIRFEAFASGHTVAKVDLPADVRDPSLFGFVGRDRLLVRGHVESGTVTALGAALGNKPDDTPVMVVVDTADPKQTRTITLPPVATTGFPLAVSAAARRLAVATRGDGAPAIVQFDLTSGERLPQAISLDLDQGVAVTPTGFAYTADGRHLGILFERDASAALLSYNAQTGKDPTELDFPNGIAPTATRTAFRGNALASLDDGAWVVYGQPVIDAGTGDVIATLPVDGVIDQRVLAGGRIELISGPVGGAPVVRVATVDPAKYRQLTHPSGATQP